MTPDIYVCVTYQKIYVRVCVCEREQYNASGFVTFRFPLLH